MASAERIAPATFPLGSAKKIRSPTPGIVAFSITTRPPSRATAAAAASASSTANVHSRPRIPGTSSRRACSAATTDPEGVGVRKKPGGPQGLNSHPNSAS